jgi:transcriptional regulator with XRE-family HTH domain
MEMNYELLGSNIRTQRILANMKQKTLAEMAGCSDKHIGQIENGKNIPSLAIVVGIANALDVGIDQLVYGDLKNRNDYYVQELLSLAEGIDAKEKLMSIEMMKALIGVMKKFMIK